MGLTVEKYEKPYFHLRGNVGGFRIHEGKLSDRQKAEMVRLAQGGEALKRIPSEEKEEDEEGNEVEEGGGVFGVDPGEDEEEPAEGEPSGDQPQKFQHGGEADSSGVIETPEEPAAEPVAEPNKSLAPGASEELSPFGKTALTAMVTTQPEIAASIMAIKGGPALVTKAMEAAHNAIYQPKEPNPRLAPLRPPEPSPEAMAQIQETTPGSTPLGPSPPPPESMPPMPPGLNLGPAQRLLEQSIKTGTEGARLQAGAQAEKAGLEEVAYQHQSDALRSIEEFRKARTAESQEQIDQLINDIKDPNHNITADHFWSDKSTLDKVRTGIGLIISGIGAGLTGAPNMAAEFLQKNIDRDIEAQKANLQKKETLLGFMFKKYGNIQYAAEASRAHLLASTAAEIGIAGARAGTAQAQATAKMLESQYQSAAVGHMTQIASAQSQDLYNRWNMNYQQWLYKQFLGQDGGGGGDSSVYHPSASEPRWTGDLNAYQKARQEQRLDWKGLEDQKPHHSYGKPGQAKDAQTTLGQLNEIYDDMNEIEKTVHEATALGAPLTPVRAQYDALQNHVSLLSGPALADIKRMGDFGKQMGEKETGESIWQERLTGGAALKTTKGIIERRMNSILAGQGVDARSLGAGVAPPPRMPPPRPLKAASARR